MQTNYKKQLTKGCNKNCNHGFCAMLTNDKSAENLARVLAVYDDVFLCDVLKKTMSSWDDTNRFIDRGCILLDYYFYLVRFVDNEEVSIFNNRGMSCINIGYGCRLDGKTKQSGFAVTDNEDIKRSGYFSKIFQPRFITDKKGENNLDLELNENKWKSNDTTHNNNSYYNNTTHKNTSYYNNTTHKNISYYNDPSYYNNSIKPNQTEDHNINTKHVKRKNYNHIYCKYINREYFVEEEIFMLEGLLYILLDKFYITKQYYLRPYIIRIFNLVCRFKPLRQIYLHVIIEVFSDMESMVDEIMADSMEINGGIESNKGIINGISNRDFFIGYKELRMWDGANTSVDDIGPLKSRQRNKNESVCNKNESLSDKNESLCNNNESLSNCRSNKNQSLSNKNELLNNKKNQSLCNCRNNKNELLNTNNKELLNNNKNELGKNKFNSSHKNQNKNNANNTQFNSFVDPKEFETEYKSYKNKNIINFNEDTNKMRCEARCCYVYPHITVADYDNTITTLSRIIDSFERPSISNDKGLAHLLRIYELLYLANEQMRLYSYERFYLHQLSTKISIQEEHRKHIRNGQSIFDFTFVLPLATKSDFIKFENGDLVKESLQETFFRALFEGEKVPYFYVKIDRKTVYAETLRMLRKTSNFDLRKQVKVSFACEEGQDQGGIKKEYFQLLSEEIREERRLFEHKNRCLWFRLKTSPLNQEFECIGKIIGIALYNNVVLNLPFPTLFFKRLLNKQTELADLAEIEPTMALSLRKMLSMSTEELEACEQTFQIFYEAKGGIQSKNLIRGGNKIFVNKENVRIFVEKYLYFLTNESVENYMSEIRSGFLSIIQPTSFHFLHARELEKIIVGCRFIDIRVLKENSVYKGYNGLSEIVKWFWEIAEGYDNEMKEKLLQFITGNDRVPVTGTPVKLVIVKNGCDTERLPSAQTCFNIIMIPEYSNKSKLEKKMEQALNFTKGFFLV